MSAPVDNMRRITVRVPRQLHQMLAHMAKKSQTSLNRIAVEALQTHVTNEQQRDSVKELSDILAPVADTTGLSEADVLRHVREARRRIWHERYRELISSSE